MNIANIETQSFIYGPGCRYVIWTQGCSIRCKGCWNKTMWDFMPKMELPVPRLFHQISQYQGKIEGITLLGGEPLDQYRETLLLLRLCAKAGLSNMLFTGYEMQEITEKGMSGITENLDILITGRYEEQKRTLNHQWIGSTNQAIHFVSDRYKDYKITNANYTELSLAEDGSITVFGFPDQNIGALFNADIVEPLAKPG
jgi:anaerobic ribonucleoside-triphosphate reductase activating protein